MHEGVGHAFPSSEGVKKWSMVIGQWSFVIGGGASRNLFLKMPRRRRIRK
jgi:hypothetical protein